MYGPNLRPDYGIGPIGRKHLREYIQLRIMSALFLILGGVFTVVSVYLLVVGISKAPEGFEDETGFHLGIKGAVHTNDPVRGKVRVKTSSPRGRILAGKVAGAPTGALAGAAAFSPERTGSDGLVFAAPTSFGR